MRSQHRKCASFGKNFVRTSLQLYFPFSKCTRRAFIAMHSLTLWYAIALCFLFSVDSGVVTFNTTLLLSQKPFEGPSISTPNIHNLYHKASFISAAIFNVTNLESKVELSIVFCHFSYHVIGVPLRKKIIPVVDRRVTRSVACAVSQKKFICTCLPRLDGISCGKTSPLITG
jgi:hypothetical protein